MYASQKIRYTFGRKTNRRLLYSEIINGDRYECTEIHSVKKSKDLSIKSGEICSYHQDTRMLIKQEYDEYKMKKKNIQQFFTEKSACSKILQLNDKDQHRQ